MPRQQVASIYPLDWHAINPEKLEPARAYSSTPCSSSNKAPSCSLKPSPGASKLALRALEDELDEGNICLFTGRMKRTMMSLTMPYIQYSMGKVDEDHTARSQHMKH